MTQKLALNPLLEISEDASGVLIRLAGRQSAHRVDKAAVKILRDIPAGRPPARDRSTEARLAWLIEHDYVLAEGARAGELAAEVDRWSSHGWAAAARYHFETYGYPFEKYSRGKSPVDIERMRTYAKEQPDQDRGKSYADSALSRTPLPAPSTLQSTVRQDFLHDPAARPSNQGSIFEALALLMLPVRRDHSPLEGVREVHRKTTPSGGSRHPTEAYLITPGSHGVDVGIHHVNSDEGSLDRLTDDEELVNACLHALGETSPEIGALVFSSVFARNRWRYREPRTFRTVHMDVGHLLTNAEYIFASYGVDARTTATIDAVTLDRLLGLSPLREHVLGAAILK